MQMKFKRILRSLIIQYSTSVLFGQVFDFSSNNKSPKTKVYTLFVNHGCSCFVSPE